MDANEFRRVGRELIDRVADYIENVGEMPVARPVEPGSIKSALPGAAPEEPEEMGGVLSDFEQLIVPGLVHWNHPAFFGYFPANNSYPSILGELLSAGLGINAMNWATSPSATELEEVVLKWVKKACGLPEHFQGVIQDSASSSTLAALLAAREKAADYAVNQSGLTRQEKPMVVYSSAEAHSSVEKAAKIAGLGREGFRAVASGPDFAMDPAALREAIESDISAGLRPIAVVATVGTTTSTACDPLPAIGEIAKEFGLFFHVDAALAGTAALLPEKRELFKGLELADSYVFNAHKWMFTNFDCSLHYVADPQDLTRTFEILPEYLKSDQDQEVNNYRDWGIALGRRFRALKLWMVLRRFGLAQLREKVAQHLDWAQQLAGWIEAAPDFELVAPTPLQTVCFRYHPGGVDDEDELTGINQDLAKRINADGRIYITPSKLGGKQMIRVSIGQTNTTFEIVEAAWSVIQELAAAGDGQ